MAKLLLTGGCGFAGSHIAEEWLADEKNELVVLDNLTYAAKLGNLPQSPRIRFVWHDFRYPLSRQIRDDIGVVDYIIHNGAESHVPRSLANPERFLESNVFGTLNLLEAARILNPKKYIYVSTDEVFGSRDDAASEDARLNPTNPYSACKASGEMLTYSYFRSFGIPAVITRCANMFGERQHPEKFVPLVIGKILRGELIDAHGEEVAGIWHAYSRKWIHVRNEANALVFLLEKGAAEKYNIAGTEKTVLEMAFAIGEILELPIRAQQVVTEKRDRNYAVSAKRIESLGWKPPISFDEGLRQTVKWYEERYREGCISGEFPPRL